MEFEIGQQFFWLALALTLWSLPWKGYALWRAARLGHMRWFIALLILNTAGILDIIYIFAVARRFKTGLPQKSEAE